jgi:hypothetical protein
LSRYVPVIEAFEFIRVLLSMRQMRSKLIHAHAGAVCVSSRLGSPIVPASSALGSQSRYLSDMTSDRASAF